MRIYLIYVFIVLGICSCSKTRICECENTNGKYVAGVLEDTKRKAKKSCEDLSSEQTKCYLIK